MAKGKRRSQPDGKTGASQPPRIKKQRINSREPERLPEMQKIMLKVKENLPETKLLDFLREKINDLETEKQETVGILGRTGSGKSSLINVVIGEEDLLPSGRIHACTTVITKVEANMENEKYEAEIKFIPLEDATDVVWSLKKTALAKDDSDGEDDSDDEGDNKSDAIEELSGLYGENWKQICSQDDLMTKKYFRQIPELFSSGTKTLAFESTKELSRELKKYTKTFKKDEDGNNFSPLVKCVTVKVPNNHFLENVTLVDLPGSGDNNETRDNMWKEVVGNCSTVWIVTEITRAAADKEAWEILKRVKDLIGNGGQCQRIHFICTKSDSSEISNNSSAAILQRNKDAKEAVKTKFSKQKIAKTLGNHFLDERFEVFTVSAKEFQNKKYLEPVDTEIPALQEVLQSLNDHHSETLNYVRGAKGILSLIHGARFAKVSNNEDPVYREFEESLASKKEILFRSLEETCEAFDSCLRTGVEKSLTSCDKAVESFLNPKRKGKGRGFHRTLKSIVSNSGAYITKEKQNLNLNETLASWLKESIDDKFSKTFPNLQSFEPFNGDIKSFTLKKGRLFKKYKDVNGMQLRLKYLSTEEEKMKIKLNKIIRDCKKGIYNNLETKIKENMTPCYDEAKECAGKGKLENMKTIIQNHFEAQKNVIFEEAKENMMSELRKLVEVIKETVKEDMEKAIEHSLKTDSETLKEINVEQELKIVTEYYKQLKELQSSQSSSPEKAGPSNA